MIRWLLVALALAFPASAAAAENPGLERPAPSVAPATAASAAADVDPNSFGPPPTRCSTGGGEGCWGTWPGSLSDTYVGGFAVASHIVRLGQPVEMTAWGYPGFNTGWNWGYPGCAVNAPECSFTPTAPSTQWNVITMPFSNKIGPAEEEDYYAVVGSDWFAIEGTVQRRAPATGAQVPAPGVTVTADGTVSTVTNGAGVYTLWVHKGMHTLAVDGGGSQYCEASKLPGACVHQVTRDVQGDITVDWRQAPYHHVRGTVTSQDGEPIEGAIVRVRPAANEPGSTVMATTETDGSYDAEVQQGPVIVDSTDPTLCVKGEPKPAGDVCARSKPIDLHSNVRVDLERTGCDQVVDFESNMIAKSDCLEVTEPGKAWKTDAPFWMNGLRLYPSGEVTLDKTLKTITSTAPVDVKLRMPKGDEQMLLPLPFLTLVFHEAAKTFLPGEYSKSNDPKVGGLAIDGAVALQWGPGTTTLALSLALADFEWQLDETFAGSLVKNNKDGISVSGTAENDHGLRRLSATFSTGRDVIFPPGGNTGGKTKFFKLQELRGEYDFPTDIWRFGGKVEAAFLSGKASVSNAGAFEKMLPTPTIDAKLDVSGSLPFIPQRVAAEAENINRQLPYGLFLQRLNLRVGADGLTPNSPAELSAGVGISLLPHTDKEKTKAPFEEIASADGQLTVSDADLDVSTLGDLALKGDGTFKVFDYQLLKGSVELYPGQASVVVDGDAQLKLPLPFGAGELGVSGKAAAWFDGITEEFAAEGSGRWDMAALGALGVRWAANRTALAACVTDTSSTLPPDFGGVRVNAGVEQDLYGIVYDWKTGGAEIGGCNLEPFQRPRPTAQRSQAIASRTVTVPRGTRSLAVRIGGAKRVEVRGPSGRVTIDAARGAKTRWLHALPGSTTFVLLKPRSGRYTVRARSGKITSLMTASAAPAPEVSGELSGGDCAPVLRWSAKRVPGQTIRLLDAGDQSVRVLGTSSKTSGSVKVTPGAGRRTVIAQVLQGGVVRTAAVLATYDAPTGVPSAPTKLRVAKAGKGVKLSWRAACGASFYTVAAGKAKPVVVRGTSLKLKAGAGETTVTAIAPSGAPGGSITRSLRPSAR